MNERWQQADAIVQDALDLQPTDRPAFVDRSCAGDDALRATVQSVLAAHDHGDGFLETPIMALGTARPRSDDGPGVLAPTRVGHYRILERLGAGGMGEVYLAERDDAEYEQKVAVKLVKRGMDTDEILRRFRAERQTLANLNHPGIARLLDGGATADGRPYIIMEYIDGQRIDLFCRDHGLGVEQRLSLFREVCAAVQYAHRNLVIHRDLKPSNILVTDGGQPKLLDFGIAKVFDSAAVATAACTETGQRLLTPEYASPEQLCGRPVGTATDVYSLGVVLYELLTLQRPYELSARSPREVERVICEHVPVRPSSAARTTLRPGECKGLDRAVRRLRGDLDTIMLMALRKEPHRRYASVEQLSEDIRRHLVGRPISARSDTIRYRAVKFASRNRIGVAAVVGVFATLCAGLGTTMWQARIAANERDATRRAYDIAQGNLAQAYLAQARAARSSTMVGRRFDSLEVLARAAQIAPSIELRNEAIACLALADAAIERSFPDRPHASTTGLAVPDRFAYAPNPGEISIVTMADGLEVARLHGPELDVLEFVFDRAGRFLVAKYRGGGVWVWDLEDHAHILTLEAARHNPEIALAPGGRWIAALQSDDRVHVYHLPSGRPWTSFEVDVGVFKLAPDQAGARLAVTSLNAPHVQIVDVVTGAVQGRLPATDAVYRPSWSADGKLLAAGCGEYDVCIWDVDAAQLSQRLLGHQGAAVTVNFDPGAQRLMSRSWDNTSRMWDVASGRLILGPMLNWMALGMDERFACRSQFDELALWRFEDAAILRRLSAPTDYKRGTLDCGAAPGVMVSAGSNGVYLWDLGSNQPLATLSDKPMRTAEIRDNTIVAAGADGVYTWELTEGGRVVDRASMKQLMRGPSVGMCLHPDDRQAIVASRERVTAVDLDSAKQDAQWSGFAGIGPPIMSDDGRWVFAGTWKGADARVWDMHTQEVAHTWNAPHVRGWFMPDGDTLLISTGRDFVFHQTGTWAVQHRIPRHTGSDFAGSAAFSSAGDIVALTLSRYEIALVDRASGELLAKLPNPDLQAIASMCFSTDDRYIIAATRERTLQVWDVHRIREELQVLGLDW